MNTLVVILAGIAAVTCNDIKLGSGNGRILFNETIQASPAIWRQSQKITINATDNEVISGVIVTDNRIDKDGEAKVVEGGEGQKNVTVELLSPTVFRGFDFNVVVYAVQGVSNQNPIVSNDKENDAQHPILIAKDTDINNSVKSEENSNDVTWQNTASTTEPSSDNEETTKTTEQTGQYTKTQEQETTDAVVKYVGGQTEVPIHVSTKMTSTVQEISTEVNKKVSEESSSPDIPSTVSQSDTDYTNVIPTDVTIVGDATNKDTSTGDVTSSTENSLAQYKQQNFDTISEELGQKVVFGIKKH